MPPGARADRPPGSAAGERGLGLVEVIVATVIATLAVLALAYSFGTGRALVDRYALARVALAAGQRRLETLATLPVTAPELALDSHHEAEVRVDGRTVAREAWDVKGWDDPADGSSPGDVDLRQVTVTVRWGAGGGAETVVLHRLFPLR